MFTNCNAVLRGNLWCSKNLQLAANQLICVFKLLENRILSGTMNSLMNSALQG